MADNPHKGHRDRLKKRAASKGFDSLEPHEQVELLLFYTIPQGNTNPIAHRLIERFGSLHGICHATEEELLAIDGVGRHTVSLLRLIPDITRAYLESSAAPVKRYDTVDKLESLLIRRYVGITEEMAILLLFGPGMELISADVLAFGSITAVTTSAREILTRAIHAHAACVVLAHNHPGGLAIPSADDLAATRQIAAALEVAGIPLLEHFVVAGECVLPMLMGENLHGRSVGSLDPRRFYAARSEAISC